MMKKRRSQKKTVRIPFCYQELENLRIMLLKLGLDSFYDEGFFLLHTGGAFLSSLGLAHLRCAHRISASRLGELVLIEDWH